MRCNHRLIRALNDIERRADAGMADVEQDADAVGFGDKGAAEQRQARIGRLMAAIAQRVARVVGHIYPADAQPIPNVDQRRLIVERSDPLQVKADAQLAQALGGAHVGNALDQHIVVGPRLEPAPLLREMAQRRFRPVPMGADSQGQEGKASGRITRQHLRSLVQAFRGPADSALPYEGLVQKGFGGKAQDASSIGMVHQFVTGLKPMPMQAGLCYPGVWI